LSPYLQLHLLIVIFAMTTILGRLMTITAPVIVSWRTFIAAITALAWVAFVRRHKLWFGWKKTLILLGIGTILGVHWLALFGSLKVSNVSISLVGLSTISLFTAFTEPLIEKRPIRPFEVLLGLIVLAGIILIAGFERSHVLGLSLGILAAFLAAIFPVLNRHFVNQGGDPLTMVGWEMAGACLISLATLPFFEPTGFAALQTFQGIDWLWMLILATVCTVFAQGFHIHLLRKISAYAGNLAMNFEPIYGIAAAAFLFGEHNEMHPAFYLGAAAIIAANLLHPWFEKRSKLP
jgi:drug/metabolite transporter (DMT)-like permease